MKDSEKKELEKSIKRLHNSFKDMYSSSIIHKLKRGMLATAKLLAEAAYKEDISIIEPVLSDRKSDDEFHNPQSFISFGMAKRSGDDGDPIDINIRAAFDIMKELREDAEEDDSKKKPKKKSKKKTDDC